MLCNLAFQKASLLGLYNLLLLLFPLRHQLLVIALAGLLSGLLAHPQLTRSQRLSTSILMCWCQPLLLHLPRSARVMCASEKARKQLQMRMAAEHRVGSILYPLVYCILYYIIFCFTKYNL